jgi:pimeloyl-ACP methyl ester carboxylesterase
LLCAHEPPLFSLVADDPAAAQFGEAVGPILEQIQAGEHEGAARDFVEKVAIGPGGWAALPEESRRIVTENAETFAGEVADPAVADVDLAALARADVPVPLTHGDQSPPLFSQIVTRLAAGLDGAEVRTVAGAGHVPQATHPEEYVDLVTRFAAG